MSSKKTVVAVAVQSVLSNEDTASFISIGATLAESDLDREKALESFYQLVYVTQKMVLSHARWEEGRLAFCKGYAETKRIPLYENGAKLHNTIKQAWFRFSQELKALYGIEKPADTSNPDSVKKAENRSKATIEKEALMQESVEALTSKVDALRTNGSLEAVEESAKILRAIEAKKKAEEKAIANEYKEKQKLIKELVGNCNNHMDLDMIIETLLNYKPEEIPAIV
jgi:hypothetical protein